MLNMPWPFKLNVMLSVVAPNKLVLTPAHTNYKRTRTNLT